jgi:DNA invertase Pin-like site-specific DNA recombinase
MKVAKAKGRLRGEHPKLNPAQEKHYVELHGAGQHTTGELAELFGVTRTTVYRAMQRATRASASSPRPSRRGRRAHDKAPAT